MSMHLCARACLSLHASKRFREGSNEHLGVMREKLVVSRQLGQYHR